MTLCFEPKMYANMLLDTALQMFARYRVLFTDLWQTEKRQKFHGEQGGWRTRGQCECVGATGAYSMYFAVENNAFPGYHWEH